MDYKQIEKRLGIPKKQASKWISEAKRRGLKKRDPKVGSGERVEWVLSFFLSCL